MSRHPLLRRLTPALCGLLLGLAGPARAGEWMDRANQQYNEGEFGQAAAAYREALAHDENRALCYFNLANAYYQLDSLPQAIVFYRAAGLLAPGFFRGHLNLAVACHALADYGAAIAAVQRALGLEPNHTQALLLLAACYRQLAANAQAVPVLERLTGLDPLLPEPYLLLGEIYRELDDLPEAIAWLGRYPESGRDYNTTLLMLAEICEEQADYERSQYYLQQSFARDPAQRWVYHRMVVLQHKQGNILLALEKARDGLLLFPNFSELAVLGGNLALEMEDLAMAERLYAHAAQHGSAQGLVGLGNIQALRAAVIVPAP
jgi:tetratricopeptide (TPR) repeat protein